MGARLCTVDEVLMGSLSIVGGADFKKCNSKSKTAFWTDKPCREKGDFSDTPIMDSFWTIAKNNAFTCTRMDKKSHGICCADDGVAYCKSCPTGTSAPLASKGLDSCRCKDAGYQFSEGSAAGAACKIPATTYPSPAPTMYPSTLAPISDSPTTTPTTGAPISNSPTGAPITSAPTTNPTIGPTRSPVTTSSPTTSTPTTYPTTDPTASPTFCAPTMKGDMINNKGQTIKFDQTPLEYDSNTFVFGWPSGKYLAMVSVDAQGNIIESRTKDGAQISGPAPSRSEWEAGYFRSSWKLPNYSVDITELVACN